MAAYSKSGKVVNPNLKIAAGAMVCDDCELIGDITIGSRTVIHPKARILAENGPIVIGEFNIIEELVTISNRSTNTTNSGNGSGKVLIIGNNNVFEVGANDETYAALKAHFLAKGKGHRPNIPILDAVSHRTLAQLYFLRDDVAVTWETVTKWYQKLFSEATITWGQLERNVKRVTSSLCKVDDKEELEAAPPLFIHFFSFA